MTENNVTVQEETVSSTAKTTPSKKDKFVAGFKEGLRKHIVTLKRKTQRIPLFFILVASLFYLCSIGVFAQLVENNSGIPATGITMFVNTLASILVLPLFLNAFPKRKKANLIYIGAVFVVLILMIVMDILFYSNTVAFVAKYKVPLSSKPEIPQSYTLLTVHIVLIGISMVVLAFLPLYKKAINKINTKKVLEENVLNEEIDTSAEV